jgi:hypothetical protein
VRQADKAVKGKTAEIQGKYETLQDHAADIASLNAKLEDLKQQSAQIEEAVNDRSYWVRMLADLNNRFENDFLWLTQIEPLKDGKAISPRLIETADVSIGDPTLGSLFPVPEDASASTTAPAAGAPESKLELRLLGLYRKNDEGQEVVYRYARALAGSEFFDIENIKERLNDYCKAETGVGEDRYAYKFEIRLPLKQPMQFKK